MLLRKLQFAYFISTQAIGLIFWQFELFNLSQKEKFDVSCQGSVPQAIAAFLESTDFEDAIRNAISIGGDSDTTACITGGIAQAFKASNVYNPIENEPVR